MTINFRDHIPHAKTAWCPLFWSFVGREAAHFRCEPDQTWQKSLVLPMLGTFTRSSSPPPDSKVQYPDLVMHELEQMRTDLNNEREYRAAMQLESSRMQESKFSLSLSLSLSLLSLLAKLLAPRTGMRIARPTTDLPGPTCMVRRS